MGSRHFLLSAAWPLAALTLLAGSTAACDTPQAPSQPSRPNRPAIHTQVPGRPGSITVNKSVSIDKHITIDKSVSVSKTIVINKGGSAEASASAFAVAGASASSSSSANVVVYGGNYYEDVTINNRLGGQMSDIHATRACVDQEATVIKSIHAVCVAPNGREFPASHMTDQTFLDASQEAEILRCIPGAHLKITVGDVLQSDQGLAGTYANGQTIECGMGEVLRHYKDGVLKCAPATPVPDCTERTNLRRFGSSDLFFSYRTKVCAMPAEQARSRSELDLSGMALDGGVGE